MKIPAIRSQMGIWVYYVTTLSFDDIKKYVKPIDDELHKSRLLSEMIQRSITDNYKSIANYLETQEERFFNALILQMRKLRLRDQEICSRSLSYQRGQGKG